MVKAETQRTVDCGETGSASLELTLAAGKASFLFPPITLRKTSAGTELCYDLQGLVSLDGLFAKDLPAFRRAIGKLPAAADLLNEYLFDISHIAWEPENIFWNPARSCLLFLLIPEGGRGEPAEALFSWAAGKTAQAVSGEAMTDEAILHAVRLAGAFRETADIRDAVISFEESVCPASAEEEPHRDQRGRLLSSLFPRR